MKAEEIIKVLLSHHLVSQKTRSALLVQADALMTFALSQEVPKEFGGGNIKNVILLFFCIQLQYKQENLRHSRRLQAYW